MKSTKRGERKDKSNSCREMDAKFRFEGLLQQTLMGVSLKLSRLRDKRVVHVVSLLLAVIE